MKNLLYHYMVWKYGIRGALKPPIRPYALWHLPHNLQETVIKFFRTKWYHWRLFCWQYEQNVYNWTGVPDEWDRLHGYHN